MGCLSKNSTTYPERNRAQNDPQTNRIFFGIPLIWGGVGDTWGMLRLSMLGFSLEPLILRIFFWWICFIFHYFWSLLKTVSWFLWRDSNTRINNCNYFGKLYMKSWTSRIRDLFFCQKKTIAPKKSHHLRHPSDYVHVCLFWFSSLSWKKKPTFEPRKKNTPYFPLYWFIGILISWFIIIPT